MLQEAISEHAKSDKVLSEFSATFPNDVVGHWENMMLEWYADPSKPNPFRETTSGKVSFIQ